MSTIARNAQVAQSVEQRTENPRVGGSIPPLGTIATSLSPTFNHIGILSFCAKKNSSFHKWRKDWRWNNQTSFIE